MPEATEPRTPLSDALPWYLCHKMVRAAKILDISFLDQLGVLKLEGVNGHYNVGMSYEGRHNPQVGGYLVRYTDGYESYSPAEAFEAGYTLCASELNGDDPEVPRTLVQDITSAINRHSAENGSNTPDYVLADYLIDCIAAFDKASNQREKWYGRSGGPGVLTSAPANTATPDPTLPDSKQDSKGTAE